MVQDEFTFRYGNVAGHVEAVADRARAVSEYRERVIKEALVVKVLSLGLQAMTDYKDVLMMENRGLTRAVDFNLISHPLVGMSGVLMDDVYDVVEDSLGADIEMKDGLRLNQVGGTNLAEIGLSVIVPRKKMVAGEPLSLSAIDGFRLQRLDHLKKIYDPSMETGSVQTVLDIIRETLSGIRLGRYFEDKL